MARTHFWITAIGFVLALWNVTPAAAQFGALLNWRPGATNLQDAPGWCSRTVTGGRVKLVQFPRGGFDTDYACF